MGLGLLGRGLGDAIFLAENGAELTITDLRDEKTLAPSLAKLKKFKNIHYTLGKHKLEDFRNRPQASGDARGPDFILKAAGVPLDSLYIAEAQKHSIPIEMDASLFAKLMPKGVTLVGVTGTRGKSTVTALIYEILSSSAPFQRGSAESSRRRGIVKGQRLKVKGSLAVFRGGNLVSEATLPLLEKVKSGDIVVLELDSWQLQGFHDAKLSPQVAVFTSFLDDHLVYYKGDRKRYFDDKAAIFKYQKPGDVLIVGEQVLKGSTLNLKKGRTFEIIRATDVPRDWKIPLLGEHNLENIACAIAVAKHFKIPESAIRKAVENFKPVPGRLEFLREVLGVKIYNDNNATTPDATIAALKALRDSRNRIQDSRTHESCLLNHESNHIVLIMGGTDKGLDMDKLMAEIPKHCKAVVMLKETGTEKLLSEFPLIKGGAARLRAGDVIMKETLKDCVETAMELAECGDTVLFSPALASFGRWFRNEYDRGNQFVEMIKKL